MVNEPPLLIVIAEDESVGVLVVELVNDPFKVVVPEIVK